MSKASTRQARARNLEIIRYGRTLLPGLKASGQQRHQAQGIDFSVVKEADDPMLTALAQLAALRMNTTRAFICLVDDQEMHILSEATRTVSPFNGASHDPGDQILYGAQSLDLAYAVSSLSVPAFLGDRDRFVNHDTMLLDSEKCIVTDLQIEPLTRDIHFVSNATRSRFYAEVPLLNPAGILIGIVCVIDDHPRSPPPTVNVEAMQYVSRLIVDYLELVSLRDVTVRAERLIQGLNHFNSGQSSIANWTLAHPKQALHTDPANEARQSYLEHATVSPTTASSLSALHETSIALAGHQSTTGTNTDTGTDAGDQSSTAPTTTEPSTTVDDIAHEGISSSRTISSGPVDVSAAHRSDRIPPELGQQETRSTGSTITHAFARASNLIRESMDLDAVCFLEASRLSHSDMETHSRSQASSRKSSRSSDIFPLGDEDTAKRSKPPTYSMSHSSTIDAKDGAARKPRKTTSSDRPMCKHLAFSLRDKASLSGDSLPVRSMTLLEAHLKEMIHVYPEGHIFNFDKEGPISSGDEESLSESSTRRSRGRRLAHAVAANFTVARSLIFLPLYDNDRRQAYAAFFGWIQDPLRLLVESESTFVSGFTNSLMCEVMRLEAVATARIKSDFMSSISHELRSPLHGILAATQLLQESHLDSDQQELATMVDSCGRTLLDIMDHVLEHARINNLVKLKRKSKSRRRKQKTNRKSDTESGEDVTSRASDVVNLVTVVEETISSVAAGHSVKSHRNEQISSRQPIGMSHALTEQAKTRVAPPVVVLNIEASDSWYCEIDDAGSWRRVIMNLVGNALKYTATGHVSVALRLESPRHGGQSEPSREAVLTVQDTGQGISESYLKHRLYTPFAQEDNLSVGVGLGLSIVDRLVSGMKGTIQFQSELEVGTKVLVRVPVHIQPPPSIKTPEDDLTVTSIREGLSPNDKVCLVGFDVYPDLAKEPTGIMTPRALALLEIKKSLTELVTAWLGLNITSEASEADVLLIEGSHSSAALEEMLTNGHKDIIVVACYKSTDDVDMHQYDQYHTITTPVGPSKLARAFKKVVRQRDPDAHGQPTRSFQQYVHDRPTPSIRRISSDTLSSKTFATVKGTDSPSGQMRLLLVDDNEINLRLLTTFVRKLNLPYTTAINGQIALDKYKAALANDNPITHIFMDLSMPVMDGLTCARHIRAHEKEQGVADQVVIIALTGLGHTEAQLEAEQSGVDHYYCKPVKFGLLRDILDMPNS